MLGLLTFLKLFCFSGTQSTANLWCKLRHSQIQTNHRSVDEVLRLAAFLLSIYDVEVDFSWLANGPISIRRDLHKQHVLSKLKLNQRFKKYT